MVNLPGRFCLLPSRVVLSSYPYPAGLHKRCVIAELFLLRRMARPLYCLWCHDVFNTQDGLVLMGMNVFPAQLAVPAQALHAEVGGKSFEPMKSREPVLGPKSFDSALRTARQGRRGRMRKRLTMVGHLMQRNRKAIRTTRIHHPVRPLSSHYMIIKRNTEPV